MPKLQTKKDGQGSVIRRARKKLNSIKRNPITDDVFTLINDMYFQMTKSEVKIADYVLSHRNEAQFMSISELAVDCKLADATITRFCRKLGYEGYNSFKLAIAQALVTANSNSVTEHLISADNQLEDDIGMRAKELYGVHTEALLQSLSVVDVDSIRKAVDMLQNAHAVYCMGQGGSYVLALEAYSLFLTVTPKVHIVQDSHLQSITAALLEKEDIVLYFSYSASTTDLLDVLKTVNERGAKLIPVSRFPKSPGAQNSDLLLQCGSNESPLRSGSVAARMAQLFVIDLLYNEYCNRDRERTRKNRALSAAAVAEKLI